MGESFDRCPIATTRGEQKDEADLASDALAFREHHLAPNAGGLLDQDPRFLEALAIVDNTIAAIRNTPPLPPEVPNGG